MGVFKKMKKLKKLRKSKLDFDAVDKDNDGFLDRVEVKQLLALAGLTDESDVEDFFKEADEDNDGKISKEEYEAMLLKINNHEDDDEAKEPATQLNSVETSTAPKPAGGEGATVGLLVAPDRHLSVLELLGICAFSFSYGTAMTSMAMLVLPIDAKRMYPEDYPSVLAKWLALSGLTHLVLPVLGYVSDRNVSSFGKRRPYVIGGSVLAIVGCLGCSWSAAALAPGVYTFCLFIANFGYTVVQGVVIALLPDLCPPSQMGAGSGCLSVLMILGLMMSFGLVGLVFQGPNVTSNAYLYYVVSCVIGSSITCMAAQEKPLAAEQARPFVTKEILLSYTMTPRSHGLFFWASMMRFLWYMQLGVQSFGLYYIADILLDCDPNGDQAELTECLELAKTDQGVASMLVAMAGMVFAVSCGGLSDRYGRKPFVAGGCFAMAGVYVWMCVCGSVPEFWLASFVYGAGNGAFMAVEYSLSVDVLPNPDDAATSFGFWGVVGFLGTTLGPNIAAPMLESIGGTEEGGHYLVAGYAAIFLLGTAFLLCNVFILYYYF